MTPRTLAPIAVIVLSACLSCWFLVRPSSSPAKRQTPLEEAPAAPTEAPVDDAPSPTGKGLPIRKWNVGESHIYEVDVARAVATGQIDPATPSPPAATATVSGKR